MKKGQGQLVAFVLLIGFTVIIGIMVGNWAIQRARKTGESIVGMGERDAMCPDVRIDPVCEGIVLRIRNSGNYKVKLKSGGQYVGGNDWIYLQKESTPISLNKQTIIPFIEIEGKEVGCPKRYRDIDENTCA